MISRLHANLWPVGKYALVVLLGAASAACDEAPGKSWTGADGALDARADAALVAPEQGAADSASPAPDGAKADGVGPARDGASVDGADSSTGDAPSEGTSGGGLLRLENHFEDSDWSTNGLVRVCSERADAPGRYSFDASIVYEGSKSLRVHRDPSQLCDNDKFRAEVRFMEYLYPNVEGAELWFGFAVYLPASNPLDPSCGAGGACRAIAWQTIGDSSGPELELLYDPKNNQWDWQVSWGAIPGTDNDVSVGSHPLTRGGWQTFVVHTIRSWSGQGLFEVWKDGADKLEHRGNTARNYDQSTGDIVTKVGSYGSATMSPGYDIYFDSYRIFEGPGGMASVDPTSYKNSASP